MGIERRSHKASAEMPDYHKLEDALTRNFGEELGSVLSKGFRNIYDDLTLLDAGFHESGTDLQNIYAQISADTGTGSAGSQSDLLNILGGVNVSTSLSGNSLTIEVTTNTATALDYKVKVTANDASADYIGIKFSGASSNVTITTGSDIVGISALTGWASGFGGWNTGTSYGTNTAYQATSDGLVVAEFYGRSNAGVPAGYVGIKFYTEADDSSPDYQIATYWDYIEAQDQFNGGTLTIPIKNGWYWKADYTSIQDPGNVHISWIPMT